MSTPKLSRCSRRVDSAGAAIQTKESPSAPTRISWSPSSERVVELVREDPAGHRAFGQLLDARQDPGRGKDGARRERFPSGRGSLHGGQPQACPQRRVDLRERVHEVLQEPPVPGARFDEIDGALEPLHVDREEAREGRREGGRDVGRRQKVSPIADRGVLRVVAVGRILEGRPHEIGERDRPFARDAFAEPLGE